MRFLLRAGLCRATILPLPKNKKQQNIFISLPQQFSPQVWYPEGKGGRYEHKYTSPNPLNIQFIMALSLQL